MAGRSGTRRRRSKVRRISRRRLARRVPRFARRCMHCDQLDASKRLAYSREDDSGRAVLGSLMESLEEGIEDVANEIQKVRWDKEPYPQNQSVINSTHIKHYLTALRQVPGGTETDLDQEDQS